MPSEGGVEPGEEPAALFEADARVSSTSRAARAALLAPMAMALLGVPFVAGAWGDGAAAVATAPLLLVILGWAAAAKLRGPPPRTRVRIEAGELVVGDARYRLDQFVHGERQKLAGKEIRVALWMRDGLELALELEDDETAERLLDRTKLSAAYRAQKTHGPPPFLSSRGAQIGATVGAGVLIGLSTILASLAAEASGLSPAWVAAVAIPLMFVTIYALVFSSRIEVGLDGVHTSFFGRARFHPYARLDRVEVERACVVLVGHDGTRTPIPVSAPKRRGPEDELAARIERGLAAWRAREPSALTALLARGERDAARWLADLDALERTVDYRTPSITNEALWSMLEDPSADPSARAAAARMLHPRIEPEDRARAARIAKELAAPEARVVLDAMADGDEEEIERALRDIGRARS